jgi:6-phosphogluconolactonase
MKKLLLIVGLLIPVLGFAQKKWPKTFDLIIGTYTKGDSKGIYVYRFYEETHKTAYLSEIDDIKNPAYLCVSSNNKFVYSADENDVGGTVSAFSFDAPNGTLKLINSQPAGGGPAYVAIDKEQKNVFAANYGNGTLTVLPVNKDGSLAPIIQTIKDEGHGINKDRQEGPHVHAAWLAPNEKYLFYTDLGTDKLNIYRYHASGNPPLTLATPPFVEVTPGNGPRHFDFSADGKYLYLIQEMAAVITVYKVNDEKLTPLQSVNMADPGFRGAVGAADIHVSPDGHFLYATNRGEANEIVAYAINQDNGQLTLIQHYGTLGKTPRNFVIDPTGRYLLVANQNSDNIVIYKINFETGRLNVLPGQIKISMPVCLKMVPVE